MELTFRGVEVACVCLVSLRMRGAPSLANLYANEESKGKRKGGEREEEGRRDGGGRGRVRVEELGCM